MYFTPRVLRQKIKLGRVLTSVLLSLVVAFVMVGTGGAQTTPATTDNPMTTNTTTASDPAAAQQVAATDQATINAPAPITSAVDSIVGQSKDPRPYSRDTMAVRASNCDKVNIIHCGLGGSSTQDRINSLKAFYQRNRDSYGNTDLRAIMRWGGITQTTLDGMTTNNTRIGTLYRNGDIKVGGKLVARDTWVTARFGAGKKGFVHVRGNVWARKTTTSFLHPSAPVLIHFNAEGKPVVAVMVNCGNVLRFKGVTPASPNVAIKKEVSQNVVEVNKDFTYTVTVTNTGNVALKNVYVYDKQPGGVQFVRASAGKVASDGTWSHTIPSLAVKAEQKFTITARVTKYVSTSIPNTACVNAPAVKPNTPQKDDACSTVPVTVKKQQPSVKIDKVVSKELVNVGEEFTYILKVTNNGDSDLANVFVYDCQPANIKFVSAAVGTLGEVKSPGDKQATPKDPCQGWSSIVASLKVNEEKTFTIIAKVTKYAENPIVNLACVNASEVASDTPAKDDDCNDAPVKVKALVYACDGDVSAIVDTSDKKKYTISTKMQYSETVVFKNAVFDFGDTQKTTVDKENPVKTVQTEHTFANAGTYTVKITLNFTVDGQEVTAKETCSKQVTVINPYYSCVRLEGTAMADTKHGYDFVVTMDYGNGATFSDADFDFGDGTKEEGVKAADAKTIKVDHVYANGNEYTVSAVLHFMLDGKEVTAPVCRAQVKSGKAVPECKPGIAQGDVRCNPCPFNANIAADDAKCQRPAIPLPNTGTGGVIAVGMAALLGGFLAYKHVVVKRHKTALAGIKYHVTNGHNSHAHNAQHTNEHHSGQEK